MQNTINRISYNKIAEEWANARNSSFVSKLVMDFSDKIIPEGDILDIGCGTGYPLTHYLIEKKFKVTGIDASEKMIEIAQSYELPNAKFVSGDFFDFVSAKKFDGILAWDSFFHFPKEKQKDIYTKVAGLLNPGGYLLFTHGNSDDQHTDTMMGETFYYSCLPKEELCRLLITNGFEIEYAYDDFLEKDTHRVLVVLAKRN